MSLQLMCCGLSCRPGSRVSLQVRCEQSLNQDDLLALYALLTVELLRFCGDAMIYGGSLILVSETLYHFTLWRLCTVSQLST